jgi:spermidine/putrescine transport system substrate-binding protein
MPHPRERSTVSRRDFLRRSLVAGAAYPSLAAILAACRDTTQPTTPTVDGTVTETPARLGPGGIPIASPENPVELPLHDDVPAIADGLSNEAGPLRIFNWNDYIYKKVLKAFEAEYGVEIEYTQFTGMSEAMTKIQNGTVDFDLFFPTVENLPKLVAGKLIQPLNPSYIPNIANVWPTLADPWYDRGGRYTVPYMTWKTGIGYRRDFVDDPGALAQPFDVFWTSATAARWGCSTSTARRSACRSFASGTTSTPRTPPRSRPRWTSSSS